MGGGWSVAANPVWDVRYYRQSYGNRSATIRSFVVVNHAPKARGRCCIRGPKELSVGAETPTPASQPRTELPLNPRERSGRSWGQAVAQQRLQLAFRNITPI